MTAAIAAPAPPPPPADEAAKVSRFTPVSPNWGNVEEISIHWPDGSHVVWVVEFESRVQRPPVPQ